MELLQTVLSRHFTTCIKKSNPFKSVLSVSSVFYNSEYLLNSNSFFIALLMFSLYSNESYGESVSGDTINKNGVIKVMHIGWEDGHVREFTNAYTLHRNEVRINIFGRSSYAFSDKVEMSSYLPMLITPNIAFKYNFIDKKHLALAIEAGTAAGIFPRMEKCFPKNSNERTNPNQNKFQ